MSRLQQLLSLIEQNPKDGFVLFALAKEYQSSGDLEKSLEHYKQLVDIDPDYVGAYYHLAKLYESLGQSSKALETYEQGMNIAKKLQDQHAWSELSSAKMNLEMEDLI